MALDVINVGNYLNDGSGDDLRTAFTKVNNNFTILQDQGGQANTISNVGLGAGIYKEKIGVDLRLRSLVGGTGITLTQGPNEITIDSFLANAIVTINGDDGTITATHYDQEVNIVGGNGVTTHVSGTTLTIDGYTLQTDNNPTLNANLQLNGYNITGGTGTTITANTFSGNLIGNVTGNLTGNVTGLVYGYDMRNVYNNFNAFDFGTIKGVVTTFPQLYLYNNLVDLGTFANPIDIEIDLGTLI